MKSRTAKYLLPVLALVLPGCWEKADTGADLLDSGVKVATTAGVRVYGRDIIIDTLTVENQPSGRNSNIQIGADGVLISMVSTGVATPTINGGDIDYGGHVVSVTATPNRFLLDGAPLDLPPNSRLSVVDGKPFRTF